MHGRIRGLLTCLRINTRGDRRYRRQEIDRFLAHAKVDARPGARGSRERGNARRRQADSEDVSRRANSVLDLAAQTAAEAGSFDQLVRDVGELLCDVAGYTSAAVVDSHGELTALVGKPSNDARVVARVLDRRQPFVAGARRDDGRYRAGMPIKE